MQRITRTSRILLVLFALFSPATPLQAAFPPVRLWGELGYDFRHERFDEDDKLSEHTTTFRLNGATFIARPWLAQVVGGVGLGYRRADVTTGDTNGKFLDGEITLRLFPFGPFPFLAFVQRRDNRQDEEISGRDTIFTRFGFDQRYTSPRFGAFSLGYSHTEQEQKVRPDDRNQRQNTQNTKDNIDEWRLRYAHGFGRHSINLDATQNAIDRDAERQDTSRLFANLRHSYSPGTALSVQNRLTYSRDIRESEPNLTVTTPALEFSSISFWRPRTARPLLVSGFLRVRNAGTETEISRSEATLATATVGFNYQWRPRWQLNGNVSATGVKSESSNNNITSQRLGLNYSSRNFKLGRFDYSWFAGPQVNNVSAEDDSLQSAGLDLGQTLRRTVLLPPRANISSSLRQGISLIEDSDGRSTQTLRHNGDISWARRGPRQIQRVRLSFSDSRAFGGGGRQGIEDSEFQLINFQASIDQRLSRFSSLSGNMTIQATRNVVARDEDTTQIQADRGFLPSAAIHMTYGHNFVFRVPRLWFRSKLRFLSDSYFPLLDDPTGNRQREQIIWENRLEYAIGRLRLRLLGTLSDSDDAERAILLFQIRRIFGDI